MPAVRSGGDPHWTSHLSLHPGLQSGARLQPPGELVVPVVVVAILVVVVVVVVVVVAIVVIVVIDLVPKSANRE